MGLPLYFLYHSLHSFHSTQADRQKPMDRQRPKSHTGRIQGSLLPSWNLVDLNPDEGGKVCVKSHNLLKSLHCLALSFEMASGNRIWLNVIIKGFPDSSVGKESTCNSVHPGMIPGLGRSSGEGIGYPLQYSWASLVAQPIKNAPAMQEIWVWSRGWENPLEKGKATHFSILAYRIPRTIHCMGLQRVRHDWSTFTFIIRKRYNCTI